MVTTAALARARAGDGEAFRELTDPYRVELQLHCYRILGRFVDAFEAADVARLVALLTDDALLTMPPEPLEYQGHTAIEEFYLRRTWWGVQAARLVPTRANGQPAFGYYLHDSRAPISRAHGLVVLTLRGGKICAITRFGDNSLFPTSGSRGPCATDQSGGRAAPRPGLAGRLPGGVRGCLLPPCRPPHPRITDGACRCACSGNARGGYCR